VALIDAETAAEMARAGDLDAAIERSRRIVDDMMDRGTPLYLGSAATVLVTSLLERNGAGDPLIAQRTVERMAALPADSGRVYLELPILHLSALVSQHRGDEAAYRDFADRYRTSSTALGFDAHIAIARAMR
jgi:adenylate cyclase